MLPSRVTGELREVDVVVRSTIAGQPVVVAIEATDTARPASSEWVERMLGKHANLPTDKLILVANGGFYGPARQLAEQSGAVPIEPDDLTGGDPEFAIANNLGSIWAKLLSMSPNDVSIVVETPNGQRRTITDLYMDIDIFDATGASVSKLKDIVAIAMSSSQEPFSRSVRMRDQAEDLDTEFTLDVTPFDVQIAGKAAKLFLRWEGSNGTTELHRIVEMHIKGTAEIRVTEVPLTHTKVSDVTAAYGELIAEGKPSVLIVTVRDGVEQAVLRIRETPNGPPRDVLLSS